MKNDNIIFKISKMEKRRVKAAAKKEADGNMSRWILDVIRAKLNAEKTE